MLAKIDHGSLPALFISNPSLLEKLLEFFTARIANQNTRSAYFHAVRTFFKWMEKNSLDIETVKAPHVALYIEKSTLSTASKKTHLAAIRSLFNFLVTSGSLKTGINPALSVKGPSLYRTTGKTPYLSGDEVKKLLSSISGDYLKKRRDRAMISIMLYTFSRVGAVVKLKRKDYFSMNKRFYLRLMEKRGKEHLVPLHHLAEKALDEYLTLTDLKPEDFVFQGIKGKILTGKPLSRVNVFDMIKSYAEKAGLDPKQVCCHSMRATGITTFLKNGGSLEDARVIANHADSRTTRLYDRRHQEVTVSEIERIRFE